MMHQIETSKSYSFSIGFDNQIFQRQQRGGITRYFHELANSLCSAGLNVHAANRRKYAWLPKPQYWRQADILHATFYAGRPYRRLREQKLVTNLFDMTPERHPEHFFLPRLRSPHGNKASWLEASDLILSISAASADDLSFFHPNLRVPLKVIHLATSIHRLSPQPVTVLKGKRFWLMIGKRHAYKNGLTLLRALALLQRRTTNKSRYNEQPLLICAGGGPWRPEERRWIRDRKIENNILQLSANENTLAWLYRNAEAVLVPSLAEGFSLPLIEALACDSPVVASDIEVHREIGEGYATFLPALNAQSWAELLDGSRQLVRPSHRLGIDKYKNLLHHYSQERLTQDHIAAYSAA